MVPIQFNNWIYLEPLYILLLSLGTKQEIPCEICGKVIITYMKIC